MYVRIDPACAAYFGSAGIITVGVEGAAMTQGVAADIFTMER
jgi:hypothetical protein